MIKCDLCGKECKDSFYSLALSKTVNAKENNDPNNPLSNDFDNYPVELLHVCLECSDKMAIKIYNMDNEVNNTLLTPGSVLDN